jgi:hypothetical protein
VELTGPVFIVIPHHFDPNSTILRTPGILTTIYQPRYDKFLNFPDGDSIMFVSLLPQPTVHLQTLPEIHCCVIRSMDRKSWTYARHSRLQGSHTRAPGRSAMSAQTRHSTRSLIPTVRKNPCGAVQRYARAKKSGRGVQSQCDQLAVTTATTI